jgi:hypothetical protein
MKTRIFPLLLLTTLLFACNSEEIVEQEDQQLIHTIENDVTRSIEEEECWRIPCDNNYTYPAALSGTIYWVIKYDPSLKVDEIDCIRQQYFNCFDYLRMSTTEHPDPQMDNWTSTGVEPEPDDEVSTTSCNDPRLNQACGD